jgi:hypothetical protein
LTALGDVFISKFASGNSYLYTALIKK